MMRRRRGPGLLMTAAVVGTAAKVGTSSANKSAQAQANQQAQNQQLADQSAEIAALQAQQAQAPAPAPAAAAPAGIDIAQLKQLGELHTAGVLSDEEFAAAKAKVLAGG